MDTKLIKRYRNLSFLGLVGFVGLKFFATGYAGSLFFFCYFSYLGYFFIYKYLKKSVDERSLSNLSRSESVATYLASTFLFLLGAIPAILGDRLVECFTFNFFVIGAAVAVFVVSVVQIATFFYLEKN